MNEGIDIGKLPAGRDMDALVAEHVMGWRLVPYTAYCGGTPEQAEATAIAHGWYIWEDANHDEVVGQLDDNAFSTDMAAAWRVVEAMHARGNVLSLEYLRDTGALYWLAYFRLTTFATADTAPLAICRAALKVVTNER